MCLCFVGTYLLSPQMGSVFYLSCDALWVCVLSVGGDLHVCVSPNVKQCVETRSEVRNGLLSPVIDFHVDQQAQNLIGLHFGRACCLQVLSETVISGARSNEPPAGKYDGRMTSLPMS